MDRVQLSWANVATHSEQECDANRRRPGRVVCEKLRCRSGRVVDLSVTGAKLSLRSWIAPRKGKRRTLSFQTLMGETDRFSCRVMWSRRCGLLRYEVGVEFVDITAQQKAQLTEIARVHTARTIGGGVSRDAA
ncbi:hypothetical protein MNBD_PLANCTO03-134 [hydrothermal vent metagenome]|uniref:PilZ domain-containing protein n=1 Tax=hydrothermal vent metagenome TaxID=652676 RepID=A0A3B1DAN2_9ZZZZ